MAIWVIGDLHLAKSVPSKDMKVFGSSWDGYMDKIEKNWQANVGSSDLVLIPGDISWAMKLHEAETDLLWLDRLKGQKLLIRGNHDYWWDSAKKMQTIMPSTVHFLHNTAFSFQGISIGGTRLWDSCEYHFFSSPPLPLSAEEETERAKIFDRELMRLELSLQQMDPAASIKIAMTHYPPIGLTLETSKASTLLEKYRINFCVFGHLHHFKPHEAVFGKKNGIEYLLTSADYLDFTPKLLLP